jgi:Zinc knuckle
VQDDRVRSDRYFSRDSSAEYRASAAPYPNAFNIDYRRRREAPVGMRCYNCGGIGHRAMACTSPTFCYRCQMSGHIAAEW